MADTPASPAALEQPPLDKGKEPAAHKVLMSWLSRRPGKSPAYSTVRASELQGLKWKRACSLYGAVGNQAAFPRAGQRGCTASREASVLFQFFLAEPRRVVRLTWLAVVLDALLVNIFWIGDSVAPANCSRQAARLSPRCPPQIRLQDSRGHQT